MIPNDKKLFDRVHNRNKQVRNNKPKGSFGYSYGHQDKEEVDQYKQKRVDTINLLKSPQENLSVYSNAVRVAGEPPEEQDIEKLLDKNRDVLESMYRKVVCTKENNKHVISLFPDIRMGIEIIIGSMLSPTKTTRTLLNYKLNKNFMTGEESARSAIISTISDYVERVHNYTDKLPSIYKQTLSSTGSCPHLFISEAITSDVINADILATISLEDYNGVVEKITDTIYQPTGLLNNLDTSFSLKEPKEVTSMEDLARTIVARSKVSLTDNSKVLRFNPIKEKLRSNIIQRASRRGESLSMEDSTRIRDFTLFRDRSKTSEPTPVEVLPKNKSATRKTIGRPIVERIPSESVIPVFPPGNKDEHVGYFIILDGDGTPVSSNVTESNFNKLNANLHSRTSQSNNTLTKIYQDLIRSNENTSVDIKKLYEMYKDIVNQEILDSFNASIYGDHVTIANNEDINFILFCRALEAQETNILYVPKENLVYFSVFNNDLGLGGTLLDDVMVIASLRSILLFAKLMAVVKQSINITEANVRLDEFDPDPKGTIEKFKGELLSMQKNLIPLGMIDPQGALDWLSKIGVRIQVEEMPGYPNFRVDYSNGGLQHTIPDSELEDRLRELSLLALDIPPELVSDAFSSEFAIGKVINQGLLAKRIYNLQKGAEPDITKFVRLVTLYDGDLRKELIDLIKEREVEITRELEPHDKNLLDKDKDEFYEVFIDRIADNIEVELPKLPENDENKVDSEFDAYTSRIDRVLDIVFDEDIFSDDILGDSSAKVNKLKKMLKVMFTRRWSADNDFVPEVFESISTDDETVDINIGSIKEHFGATLYNTNKMFDDLTSIINAANKDSKLTNDKLDEKPDEMSSGSWDSGSSSSSDSDSGNSEEGGGGLDEIDFDDW